MTRIHMPFAVLVLLASFNAAWSQESRPAEAKWGDAARTRPEAEYDWGVSLLIVEADWSTSESAKEIEADLRRFFAEQIEDIADGVNLAKQGAQYLLPESSVLYAPEDFDNFHAWLEKHKLVKSVQHGFSFGDYNHIGERIAKQTGYHLPMRRLTLFPGGAVDDPAGGPWEAKLPFPSLKPWSDAKSAAELEREKTAGQVPRNHPDERRLQEPNSVHYVLSFGLAPPGQENPELENEMDAALAVVAGRRIALTFPPAGSKQGPKIHHDCWLYFSDPGERVAVIPWFVDSPEQQQAAEKAGQVPLLIFHTAKSRMPGFEGWDKSLKKDEPKPWKSPTPGIHISKSGLPLITRVTSRVATARLLLIKSDWSAVPAAKQIKLDVWDALRDVPVAQELLDKLPSSAPEILFAPEVVSLYRGENSGKLLAWLKSKELLISEERFPPPDPRTVVPGSGSSSSSMGYGGAFSGGRKSGRSSSSGMSMGPSPVGGSRSKSGSSMGPVPGGNSFGSRSGSSMGPHPKGRPSPRSPEPASSIDRYALQLSKDGQFIPLPRLSQFTSQPFVKRKPELNWTIVSQGGFDNPQIFSRTLATREELRGEAPRILQPVIDGVSLHFSLPANHAALMQAFPAAGEGAFRDAAREMGFLPLILVEAPDIAGIQDSADPQLVLPDKVDTPAVKHEPKLSWNGPDKQGESSGPAQSTGGATPKTPSPVVTGAKAKADIPFVATLVQVKADWSKVPAAKEIGAELREALKDVAVPKELIDKLPASGPQILFAPEVVSFYSSEHFAEFMGWLKSKELVVAEEQFEQNKAPPTVDPQSNGWGDSSFLSYDKNNSSQLEKDEWQQMTYYAAADVNQDETITREEFNAFWQLQGEIRVRNTRSIKRDEMFLDLPLPTAVRAQPFVARRPELSWSVTSYENSALLGAGQMTHSVSRNLAVKEQVRGRPDLLKWVDNSSTGLSLPDRHVAVINAFPARTEAEYRAAAQRKGFETVIVITRTDERTKDKPSPRLHLPDQIEVAFVSHEAEGRRPWETSTNAASPAPDESATKIIHLQHASASNVLNILQRLFPEDIKVAEDERTNAIIVSGAEGTLAELEAIVLRLDDPGSAAKDKLPAYPGGTVDELKQQYADAEQDAASLAKESQPKKDKLRAAVAKAFELRQKVLQAELADFRQRTERIEQSLKQREGIKQQIIERRVEDLLKPALKWEGAKVNSRGKNQ